LDVFATQASKSVALLAALALLASSASAGGVRIASAAGGPSYATLGAAVAAASDGDVLLVGAGAYVESSVLIQGKSLTVIGVSGDPQLLLLSAAVTVRDLPAGGRVLLRGLTIAGGMYVLDCDGPVRVEDCALVGPSAPFQLSCIGAAGTPGVRMSGSLFASFVRCRITGGKGEDVAGGVCGPPPKAGAGASALVSDGGQIALYECELEGGDGGDQLGTVSPASGGSGLSVSSIAGVPSVFASGCTFQGGDGSSHFGEHSLGGYAAFMGTGTLTQLDCSFIPGQKPPSAGPTVGNVTTLPGESRAWSAAPLVPAGAPFAATLEGVPGDALWALRGSDWIQIFTPALSGVLHVAWPQHLPLAPLGVVPPGGSVQVLLPGVRVPAGQVSSPLTTQAWVRPTAGATLLGGPQHVLGLSPDVGPDCNANGVSDYFDVVLGGVPDANHNLIPDSCPGG
jgi:hypothetical protein